MSSCRPRFSPSPERESGHYWHPARLPNQSPLREGEGRERRREGGKKGERGRNKKESVEQRGKEKKEQGEDGEERVGGGGVGGEKDLRGIEAGVREKKKKSSAG